MPRRTCFASFALALLVLALAPAAGASAATPGNPQVLRLPATGGTPTVLAGGSPWTSLYGTALGADGTLYVANQGNLGPNPAGMGLYSLANAATAPSPSPFSLFSSGGSNVYPNDVVATPSTLYEVDSNAIVAINPATPSTRTTVSSGQLFSSLIAFPQFGAVSGTTMYVTAEYTCQSAEGGGAYVIAIDLTTGTQTQVATLGCASVGGIAVEPAGTLLVAETTSSTTGGGKPRIVRITPSNGQVTALATSGKLKAPQGIALSDSTLYVADQQAGVLAVNPVTGAQTVVSAQGGKSPLGGAYGISAASSGTLFVSEAGVPPTLRASAASRQKLGSSGLALTPRCNRTCTVAYTLTVDTPVSYAQGGAFPAGSKARRQALKVPAQVVTRVRTALKQGKSVSAKLKLTPQDPNSGSPGKSVSLTVRLIR